MDPNELVASTQQAALSSIQQAASTDADASTKEQQSSIAGDQSNTNGGSSDTRSNAPAADAANHNDDDEEDEDEDEDDSYMQGGDAGEMSFVIDTAGDMDVDREIALEDEAKAEHGETHMESGLLLPTHVNVIPQADSAASQAGGSSLGPSRDMTVDLTGDDEDLEGDLGDFEQLDMDPSTANRYYGAEEKAERRAKEQCLACGELGHDRRHCPHQHCLACGAMDEHPTRFCPLSTSCFRCGGMGHQTRTCPKPRRGPRSEECERCGSYSHVKALCPTLWRVYTYSTLEDYDRHQAKAFFKLQSGSSARDPRRDLEPDPAELSDSEDEFTRAGEPEAPTGSAASQFDPATRWCYNCSTPGNHWGDDCPEQRVNPTRGTGEPSAFSEFVSRLGPFAKNIPGAPPLAGFQMPSSQFTFSVGSSATMHVAGDAVPSSSSRNASGSNSPRRGQTGRDKGSGAGLAIGKHFLSSRETSQPSSPRPTPSSSRSRNAGASSERNEKLVSFDRTKAVACEGGGFLTRKEKKKGKMPLPEHLFRQWVRDRHDYPEHAEEIRRAFEKRAQLEAKGQDAKGVATTRDIVGESAYRKKGRNSNGRSNDDDSKDSGRPNKKRRGDSATDPVIIDDDHSSYRDDFSSGESDSDSDSGKGRRRGGKNKRKNRSEKSTVHTGWGHNGDGGGSGGGGPPKRGKFASKRKSGAAGGGDSYRPDNNSNGGGGGGGKKGRRGRGVSGGGSSNGGGGGGKPKNKANRCGGGRGNAGNGGGGEKLRGGGSKYRGGYF